MYVNATSNDQWGTVNTDGYDSWNSDNLLIENAIVDNGDDCIAVKGNTTNLFVKNVTCYSNRGMTIGSLGQYPATPDYVQNVTFEDVKCLNCIDGAYVKTWAGVPASTSGNGDAGGGGSGLVKNVTFNNFEMVNVAMPMQLSQCIYSEGSSQFCNTSKMAIEDVTWSNIYGTSRYNIAAMLYCSAVHPCPGIKFENVHMQSVNHTLHEPMYGTDIQYEVYGCTNLVNPSGIPCNYQAPNNFSQTPTGNVN